MKPKIIVKVYCGRYFKFIINSDIRMKKVTVLFQLRMFHHTFTPKFSESIIHFC